jgi:hypothetical protein
MEKMEIILVKLEYLSAAGLEAGLALLFCLSAMMLVVISVVPLQSSHLLHPGWWRHTLCIYNYLRGNHNLHEPLMHSTLELAFQTFYAQNWKELNTKRNPFFMSKLILAKSLKIKVCGTNRDFDGLTLPRKLYNYLLQ